MKKITVSLNPKSIQNAIKEIENFRRTLEQKVIPEFLDLLCQWIIARADFYIDNSDIGQIVKDDIKSHWQKSVNGKTAKITNDAWQAVFVEFGVGSMGKQIPHDNAEEADYRYNIKNKEWWVYPAESIEEVDMHKGYQTRVNGAGQLWIITKGSWRVMYAYQALIDARDDLANPNGEISQIWELTKERYLG